MSNDYGTRSPPFATRDNWEISSEIDDSELDGIFDALSHPHRRCVLSYLIEEAGPVPVDELYDHVASDVAPSASESDVRNTVEATFHHRHRPKLEDRELIEYDDEKQTVKATVTAAKLKSHLRLTA